MDSQCGKVLAEVVVEGVEGEVESLIGNLRNSLGLLL